MAAQSNSPTAANGSTAGQSMPALREGIEGISVRMQGSLGRVTVQPDVVLGIRENLSARIEGMTGLKVKEINLDVVDLFSDEDLHAPAAAPRVQ